MNVEYNRLDRQTDRVKYSLFQDKQRMMKTTVLKPSGLFSLGL